MKKLLLIIFVLSGSFKGFSQDSIVNYLDRNGKVIDKTNAFLIETIVKKDSLWKFSYYYRNGKLQRYEYFKTKDKKKPVGKFVTFNRKGKISSILFFNKTGKKVGPYRSWFDNGNIGSKGIYINDKKESIWKYYHYNGNEACRLYYKNDSILKTVIFDKEGDIKSDNLLKRKKAKFKGGQDKFVRRIKKLTNNINYQVKGKVYVNFVINVDGKIQDVNIDDVLPVQLKKEIVSFFENIEGWEPGIHMNRKVPTPVSIPLNFK